jgi:hypothetical protein
MKHKKTCPNFTERGKSIITRLAPARAQNIESTAVPQPTSKTTYGKQLLVRNIKGSY